MKQSFFSAVFDQRYTRKIMASDLHVLQMTGDESLVNTSAENPDDVPVFVSLMIWLMGVTEWNIPKRDQRDERNVDSNRVTLYGTSY